jgi:hypothetical protein
MFNAAFLEKPPRGKHLSRALTSETYRTCDAETENMKTKILLSIAVTGIAAMCSGTGGPAGGTAVGPVGTPTSATPQPTTSQTPGLTLPPAGAPVQPNVSANPNMSGNFNGNGNGNFNNRFANTNSLYTITNPPGQLNSQSFGNPPGAARLCRFNRE